MGFAMVFQRMIIIALFGDVLLSSALKDEKDEDAPVGDGPGHGLSQVGATSGEEAACEGEKVIDEELDIPESQIKRDSGKKGIIGKATMLFPAATKMVTNAAATGALAAGYAVGKVMEKVTGGKAADSTAFQLGLQSMLAANGISLTIEFWPIPPSVRERLGALYEGTIGAGDDETWLTPVIVSNHVSYFDGLALASVFKAPKIVAKAGVKNVPAFGKLMEEMEVIFVNRGDGGSREGAKKSIKQHCADWSFGKRPLLIFPEGTTTNGEELTLMRKGVFENGAPVRPVLIVPTGHWDPAATSYKMTPEGPEKTSDKEYAAEFLGHWSHPMHIAILPPYVPSDDEKANAILYATNVQQMMDEELKTLRMRLLDKDWHGPARPSA